MWQQKKLVMQFALLDALFRHGIERLYDHVSACGCGSRWYKAPWVLGLVSSQSLLICSWRAPEGSAISGVTGRAFVWWLCASILLVTATKMSKVVFGEAKHCDLRISLTG